ncbi:MAG TPA: hypothetical protein VN461_13980 [Vicinamibacteria bacterium]|jgi:hypothetical protein|nr:hypothetical protein [Vicinamibacteria bacterium]
MRRSLALAPVAVTLLVGVAWLTPACNGRSEPPPRRGAPSHAADAIVEKAPTPEERRALERIRDEIDLEMLDQVRAIDAEIETLRRENEELRKRLPEP